MGNVQVEKEDSRSRLFGPSTVIIDITPDCSTASQFAISISKYALAQMTGSSLWFFAKINYPKL